jgi:signal transduction histidine kinase
MTTAGESVSAHPVEVVEATMYRALAVLRVVVLLNTAGLFLYRGMQAPGGSWTSYEHPVLAGLVVLGLAVWTGVAIWAYERPGRRGLPLLATDLLVAVGAILLTPVVVSGEVDSTLPGFWVMAVVLAWGIHWHWSGGLAASSAVSLADVSVRSQFDQTNYGNIFLLMLGGPILGYTSGLLKEMAAARDRAEREAAAAAERARLARAVHDGVLQVLALVQKRGAELGGEAAGLARLAGEQEVALRALVQRGVAPPGDERPQPVPPATDRADLAALLAGLATPAVTVSGPGSVVVPRDTAAELLAVVRECLDNVRRHVGEQARAWVLLEDLGDRVVVTVRDEGPGIPAGRLDQAEAEGRLGVCQSIVGRVEDLGGTASLTTAPGAGVEWELSVPR